MTGQAAVRRIVFVTHAEVEIDPERQVTDWPLKPRGCARHAAFAANPALQGVTAVFSGAERKAREGAAIHASDLGLTPKAITALGENDRSATGYLPPAESERMADAFFASPDESVRGWASARAAQARILAAVRTIAEMDPSPGDIRLVSHEAVGTPMRCASLNRPISRAEDQPAGGGNHFTIDLPDWTGHPEWRVI